MLLITFLSQLSTLGIFCYHVEFCSGIRLGSASVCYNTATSKLSLTSSIALQNHRYCKQGLRSLTQTTDRYIVGDRFHDGPQTSGHKKTPHASFITCNFARKWHSINQWCQLNSNIKIAVEFPANVQHYMYFYNWLMDYWHNKNIIQKQLHQMNSNKARLLFVTESWPSAPLHVCMFTMQNSWSYSAYMSMQTFFKAGGKCLLEGAWKDY